MEKNIYNNIKPKKYDNNLYNSFLSKVTKFNRLSKEEERILGSRVRDEKDEKSAKKLILHNMRLNIKIAHEYRRSWTNLMDLIQEASVGMTIAVRKWDPDKNVSFGTYAGYWIRAQLIKFLMVNSRLIHTGNTKSGRKIYFNLSKIKDKLISEGKETTVEIIAKEINENPKEVALVLSRLQSHEASLSTSLKDNNIYTLQDALNSGEKNPEDLVAQYQINEIMHKVTKRFEKKIKNKRDLDIWKKHLISNNPESLKSLGDKYNISKQRVGQLSNKIKKSFRCHIINELGPNTNLSWLFSK